ncbi:type III-B CRISPR module RAMP protein Cmr6 [Alicyclobacillus mali]|uniref:Type III-B CRISPR module RAMP protein Cmr6 n=1 Tax=Alicyclobacillus mali (ex Roth et al. 2021) TaxID=1123961 RepID=A0ABS0F6V8_9BACL|nr:type III-B CRISPR module RAMP protein Cmr6 [Alicyclobacillus mali (ex Roth et al. 2021)]MBF8379034.1 type III-B CRISPR module RAMP protein Cmr6 [Alicyclobacillus mali (ex Roth et al. 2021)]MCL6488393.1 type III-B CRISPR module RAMP protein Cmr6 [Alicyclobacillus mali (ex Roth et al. 2021)]
MRDRDIRGPLAQESMWETVGAKLENPGLVFQRFGFAGVHEPQGDAGSLLASAYERIHKAFYAAQQGDLYLRVYQRAASMPSMGRTRHVSGEIEFEERVAVGLGRESVYEVGLMFHPVYGVPYIPGSTLKGLLSHFVHDVVGQQGRHPEFQRGGEGHRFLFGTIERDDEERNRGALIFYDALIKPEALKSLRLEVMTIHYPSYYRGLDTPHGMDDPIPVHFLSLDRPTFLLRLGMDCEEEKAEEWLAWSWDRLLDALSLWGVGGKKSSGYGRAKRRQAESVGSETEEALPSRGSVLLVRRIQPPDGKQGIWFETVNPPRLYGNASSVPPHLAPEIGGTMELMIKEFYPHIDAERVLWDKPPAARTPSKGADRSKGRPGPRR